MASRKAVLNSIPKFLRPRKKFKANLREPIKTWNIVKGDKHRKCTFALGMAVFVIFFLEGGVFLTGRTPLLLLSFFLCKSDVATSP